MKKEVCLHCGETRQVIKERGYLCAIVTYEGETDCEWARHRFKPYSKKELEAIKRDEDEYIKQMGEMYDFVYKEIAKEDLLKTN